MVSEDWVLQKLGKLYQTPLLKLPIYMSGDHFHVRIISEDFIGLRPLQRQMPVLKHFKKFLEDNSVHALDLKCMTPEQAKTLGNTAFDPHSGKQEFFGIHVRRPKKE